MEFTESFSKPSAYKSLNSSSTVEVEENGSSIFQYNVFHEYNVFQELIASIKSLFVSEVNEMNNEKNNEVSNEVNNEVNDISELYQ